MMGIEKILPFMPVSQTIVRLLPWAFLTLLAYSRCGNNQAFSYLDSSFGTNGKVIVGFPALLNDAYALLIQSDGKIVVGGRTKGDTWDFALARYNSNGTIDSTFGSGGLVTTDFNSSDDGLYALGVQSDGKIVAGGYTQTASPSQTKFALARYTTSGAPDSAFGTGGLVTTAIGVTRAEIKALAVQADGKILAAGFAKMGRGNELALARYDSAGLPDPQFNTTGMVTKSIGSDDAAQAVAVLNNGKILAAGYSLVSSGYDFALIRFTSTGSVDTSFGTQGSGYVTTNFLALSSSHRLGSSDKAYSMGIAGDDHVVLAGQVKSDSGYLIGLAAYDSNGAALGSFNSVGTQTISFTGAQAYGQKMVLDPTGLAIIAGYMASNTVTDIALTKVRSDGTLDTTYATGGKLTTDIDSTNDQANAIARQSDGKIVVAGTSDDGLSRDMFIVRYAQ